MLKRLLKPNLLIFGSAVHSVNCYHHSFRMQIDLRYDKKYPATQHHTYSHVIHFAKVDLYDPFRYSSVTWLRNFFVLQYLWLKCKKHHKMFSFNYNNGDT